MSAGGERVLRRAQQKGESPIAPHQLNPTHAPLSANTRVTTSSLTEGTSRAVAVSVKAVRIAASAAQAELCP